jgi:hypothetical protein
MILHYNQLSINAINQNTRNRPPSRSPLTHASHLMQDLFIHCRHPLLSEIKLLDVHRSNAHGRRYNAFELSD